MYEKIGAMAYAVMKPFMGVIFSGRMRTRVLIVHDSQVLLLRNWIGKQDWSMSGGGVKKGEEPKKALAREAYEELGLHIQVESLEFLLQHEHHEGKANYPISIFLLTTAQKPSFTVHRPEIIEARWFDIDELPKPTNDSVKTAITAYSSKHKG